MNDIIERLKGDLYPTLDKIPQAPPEIWKVESHTQDEAFSQLWHEVGRYLTEEEAIAKCAALNDEEDQKPHRLIAGSDFPEYTEYRVRLAQFRGWRVAASYT